MPTFRIFTNDRGKHRGVPMYSALKDVRAKDAEAAERSVPLVYALGCERPVAIEWPVKTEESKNWLAKHV